MDSNNAILRRSVCNPSESFACFRLHAYPDVTIFSVLLFSQLMSVQIAMVFHLIAVVRITIFAKARVVTLENVNLIAQVQRRHFFGKPRGFPTVSFAILK